jgi:hypothetical protein
MAPLTGIADRLLASIAWLPHRLRRLAGGHAAAVPLAMVTLAIASAIPTLVIATTPYPWTVTLADLEDGAFEGMPTWIRVSGDLRAISDEGSTRMNLVDPSDQQRFITVESDRALQPGPQELTGRIYTDVRPEFGGIAGLHADTGFVPQEDQPWPLILAPLALAVLLGIGLRLGYPVLRAEQQGPSAGHADAGIPARWYGHLGGRNVEAEDAVPAAVSHDPGGAMWQLQLRDAAGTETAGVRRGGDGARAVRACTPARSLPGIQLLASNAQVVLLFEDRAARDALFATFAR